MKNNELDSFEKVLKSCVNITGSDNAFGYCIKKNLDRVVSARKERDQKRPVFKDTPESIAYQEEIERIKKDFALKDDEGNVMLDKDGNYQFESKEVVADVIRNYKPEPFFTQWNTHATELAAFQETESGIEVYTCNRAKLPALNAYQNKLEDYGVIIG